MELTAGAAEPREDKPYCYYFSIQAVTLLVATMAGWLLNLDYADLFGLLHIITYALC